MGIVGDNLLTKNCFFYANLYLRIVALTNYCSVLVLYRTIYFSEQCPDSVSCQNNNKSVHISPVHLTNAFVDCPGFAQATHSEVGRGQKFSPVPVQFQ